MPKETILIVDDEKGIRDFLEIYLKKEGYKVNSAPSGEEAMKLFGNNSYELVISDIKMSGMNGVELLKNIKGMNPDVIVLMITAYASVDTAIDAMKAGAYDYITKPFNVDEVKHIIRNALDKKKLEAENLLLKKELKRQYGFSNLIGTSSKMLEIYGLIRRFAETRANILITGESGTGKELVARAIHYEGNRKDKPFVPINCGAIPENLLESELFGHEKGAFTGAVANKSGLFEIADEGTIFLDEITELPKGLQVKLLRVVQERNFRRVGGVEDVSIDVRIISASNKDIDKEVKEGRFREDLFYRLNVIPIHMPPLRERKDDIPVLCQHFLEKYCHELGRHIKKISGEAMELLINYRYPGNIRELENIIERTVALESTDIILSETMPDYMRTSEVQEFGTSEVQVTPDGLDFEKAVENFERAIVLKAIEKADGVQKKAAEILKISPRSLRYLLQKYGIEG